ncbi:MAG: hypothetical protein WC340_17910 [Kiritimatiellia bacterium]
MIGFPKHLNCKQDFYNLLDEYPDQVADRAGLLLASRTGWVTVGKLAEDDLGITDDTHRVAEITDDDDVVIERYQEQYMEDPNAEMFRLGFTVEELEAMA